MLGSCLTSQPQKWSLSVKQQPEQKGQVKQAEREAHQRRGKKRQRWRAAFCSETHLSWIVSVSVVEQDDGEAVRVCECLYGLSERQTKNKETKKKTQRCNVWEKQNGHSRQWKSQWGAIHKWQTSEQWRTAVRPSGSEKVKPSANSARGRTQETEAKCQLDAAGWLHSAHHRHTLTCVFSTPAWKPPSATEK